ncbi:MAG: PH domain-containing protein [Candidatus Jordarchaeum sp.]|uniref:PH domain-containing protein n=1 Tax=Candidatus Jordarchaeum sp. TaxID=2823881 RepID=UPI00404B6A21
MKKSFEIQIGEDFKPAPQFRKLYYAYLVIAFCFLFLPWYFSLLGLGSLLITGIIVYSIFILPILVFVVYWIRKYYNTIFYKLTDTEIVWRRGVWFKNTGIVPYNRITNIDIGQGPISRRLRIAALKIQTAGYTGKAGAEIKLNGIEQFEELREVIMKFVRGKKPLAVETYEEDTNLKILNELRKIRKLLEKSQQK